MQKGGNARKLRKLINRTIHKVATGLNEDLLHCPGEGEGTAEMDPLMDIFFFPRPLLQNENIRVPSDQEADLNTPI